MKREVDPERVAQGLAALAAIYVPETVAEGRARLLADTMRPDVLPGLVARRLETLRALYELAQHLAPVTKLLREQRR